MKRIAIVGSGLVGSFLAIVLARRGYAVRVFERNPDRRASPARSGRSINLTLCHRGLAAIERIGATELVRDIAMPAFGRMVHDERGETVFQPYGNHGEALHSVLRNELNRVLLDLAQEHGVELRFRHRCCAVDFDGPTVTFEDLDAGGLVTERAAVVLGTDGAHSAVRLQMQRTERFDYSQSYIQQGYKELSVPAAAAAAWGLDRNALHLWPRGRFMLIGFANHDGSFTLALHLPYEGEPSFASIRDETDLLALFARSFPDTLDRIPDLVGDFFNRPISSMVTIRCFPWVTGRVALVGDAAHAIVPSYGQGANCGFEDCIALDDCLDRTVGDWDSALAAYQRQRKPNAEVIADLSLQHFAEIRDRVGDPRFLLRKAVERRLDELYPGVFVPLYSLVSFTSMSYVEARERARELEALVDYILEVSDLESRLQRGTLDEVLRAYAEGGDLASGGLHRGPVSTAL